MMPRYLAIGSRHRKEYFFELQESGGPKPRSCGLKVLFSYGTYGSDYPLAWLQTLEKCISQSHSCENHKEEFHLSYSET
jgi:hypothetical protein